MDAEVGPALPITERGGGPATWIAIRRPFSSPSAARVRERQEADNVV
jgi:hypothetical protein